MSKRLYFLLLALLCIGPVQLTAAQGATSAEFGDPPIASLISVSAPDEDGVVTIEGAAGAVFPTADVAVRNLYTEETVYQTAGITGSFRAELYGPGETPFIISPAQSIPPDLRAPGTALPGGPATVIRGNRSDATAPGLPITQLVTDGDLTDWGAYPQAGTGDTLLLQNSQSLYIGTAQRPDDITTLQITLGLGTAVYQVFVPVDRDETAIWTQTEPIPRELGALAAVATNRDALEARLPLEPILDRAPSPDTSIIVTALTYLGAEDSVLSTAPVPDGVALTVDEQNGVVFLDDPLDQNATRFDISGAVAGGASTWYADGQTGDLDLTAGDNFTLTLDFQLTAPDLAPTLTSLSLIGEFHLLPVTDGDGLPVSGTPRTSNGFATLTTPSGLPIENVQTRIPIATVRVPSAQVLRRENTLQFGMVVDVPLPDDLPAGTYVPAFQGFGQIGDGERFSWQQAGLFGSGDGLSNATLTRLPLVMNVDMSADEPRRLLWTLFQDAPSNGARGVLSEQDQAYAALSNRVKFNPPTYILPPSVPDAPQTAYTIEPYLLGMLPNTYNITSTPLLPLTFPTGRISGTITQPDGSQTDLNSAPILQNQLSTTQQDERDLFGAQSQVDVYQLTTLDDAYSARPFDQYGDYQIELDGFVEDAFGNRYEGGGTYNVTVAEALTLRPGALPGTPFTAGDALNNSLRVAPGVPADVTMRVQLFPLSGGQPLEQIFEGQANRFGIFQAGNYTFEAPGEYLIDYEARYTDSEGRLWAGSLRSAGVVARRNGDFIAHGERGLANAEGPLDPAWYYADTLTPPDTDPVINPPYHSGDVVWVPADSGAGIFPNLRLQDTLGVYATWLQANQPDYTAPDGTPLNRLALEDALPVRLFPDADATESLSPLNGGQSVNEGYSYVSYVRPGLALRQMVLGSETTDLPLAWTPDDPLNRQIGAGAAGTVAGDYVFLFGGTVTRNSQAEIEDTSGYAALGVVTPASDPDGARVFPPYRGAAHGPDGGPLLTLDENDIDIFFVPTAAGPGDVLQTGDQLSIAGQVAPPLASDVSVTLTAPNGEIVQFSGQANAAGYFYAPLEDITVEQIGVWRVTVTVQHTGRTSAGMVNEPFPTGGTLGTATYSVYVVPPERDAFDWAQYDTGVIELPPTLPANFSFAPPEGWTDVTPYLTATIPSYTLQDEQVDLQGALLRYAYSPAQLNQRFPFYEANTADAPAQAGSDPFTLTVVFTGQNTEGAFDVAARQVLIRYDRLLAVD